MTDTTGGVESDAADEGAKTSKSHGARRFARDILFILLAAILISFLLKTFLIRSFYIPSVSMTNTLMVNDRIIVNELEPRFFPLSRGDVVVFTDPGGWLPSTTTPDTRNDFQKVTDSVLGFIGLTAPDSNDHLVKRIIGLPGDNVTCCGNSGTLSVNGVPLDEPYINVPKGSDAAPKTFDVTVPSGDLWVMGDNRDDSDDSLAHNKKGDANDGFLTESSVVGRAFVISWPSSRWTWLSNYPTTFHGTDPDSK
jgi:signal peptidase I